MELNEKLLQSTFPLFKRYGIRSVSMDDLAREIGVSKKTIYQMVENKADLVSQLCREHHKCTLSELNELRARTSDAMEEILAIAQYTGTKFRDISPAMVYDLQKYYPAIWKFMDQHFKDYFHDLILSNLKRGREEGLYREDFDCEIVARIFAIQSSLIANSQTFPLNEFNLHELVTEHYSYHANGVASHAGRKRMRELLEQTKKENSSKDQ